ncbi:MAG: ATP-binding protein [Chlamydiae bacterium]|nr:ATP-binding protein [Chlamydiota bacterium]MBI3276835.1 ATP-binding protein [Chlamydiota bacterium]
MKKEEIIAILKDWNFWEKDLSCGVRRPVYLENLERLYKTNQVIVITGPRRAGKSFLMRQLARDLFGDDAFLKKEGLFINFEDPRWPKFDAKFLQKIYETYLEFLAPSGKPTLFLDEIQEVQDWEKWVLSMHELEKARIVLSGSNAKLLGKELSTLLTGRHVNLTVFPLSFQEKMQFRGISFPDPILAVSKKVELAALLRETLEFGSFPQVVLSGEKQQILLAYFDDIVSKDLVRRFQVRKTEKLKALARLCFSNVASGMTFNSMGHSLDLSPDTVEKFSNYFEEVYLFTFLKRFSFKAKEQEKSPRKIYPVDVGLANAVGFRSSSNQGRLLECLVFQELCRRRAQNSNMDLYYWKDDQHREIDFVVKEGLHIHELIQVSWNLDQAQTKKREVSSLLKGMDALKMKEGVVITEEFEGQETLDGKTIHYKPVLKWLLTI